MTMKSLAAALLALPLAAFAGTADGADCKTKLLTGVWVGHATVEADYYCLIQVKQNGWITRTSCFNPKTLKPVATLEGRFTVDHACKVTAAFEFKYTTGPATDAKFKGKLDPEKGLMSGDFVVLGASEAYRFSQQWN